MYSFVIREFVSGTLIGLPAVIERLPLSGVTHWRFCDITLAFGTPFGDPISHFEERTRISPAGVCVTNEAFNDFLRTDFQIIDGCIYGLSEPDASMSLFCLECEDASKWEISTEFENIANELAKRGVMIQ